MAERVAFTGFAGVRLAAEVEGREHDPAVLLIHGGGQTHAVWVEAAAALVDAGRRVISLDLRGHGASEWPSDARYDFDSFVTDLRSVLGQLDRRPVVVAAGSAGWIAAAALADGATTLAAGLVLVDLPTDMAPETTRRVGERLRDALTDSDVPAWDIRWLENWDPGDVAGRLAAAAPRLTLPVLLIQGGLSDIATAEQTSAFTRALPDIELAHVADARLLVADQRIDAFNALLLDFLERRQPRAASEFRSGSDARTLREALGCFATGVTIVTATTADGPIGLTANSFTSLSLDPPLLLVCIPNGAGSAGALREADHFAVNILQIGQQPVSNRFAGKGQDRFAETDRRAGEMGAPVLNGSLGAFECSQEALHEGGDHFILVGRVHKATFEPRRDPLLYFRGRYRRLHFA